jgi:hypothetical protein
MNDKTGGNRGLRRAGALAAAAAVAVLTAGCGVVHVHFGSAPAGPATYQESLAYARCMRAHGLPDFPIPQPSEGFSIGGHFSPNTRAGRANDACKHLLSR